MYSLQRINTAIKIPFYTGLTVLGSVYYAFSVEHLVTTHGTVKVFKLTCGTGNIASYVKDSRLFTIFLYPPADSGVGAVCKPSELEGLAA